MLTAAKDWLTGTVAQKVLNTKLERYGRVTLLQLDSRLNQAEFECALHGEERPVRIIVEHYTVRRAPGRTCVRVDSLVCDRLWLDRALKDLVRERWFDVPGWIARFLL